MNVFRSNDHRPLPGIPLASVQEATIERRRHELVSRYSLPQLRAEILSGIHAIEGRAFAGDISAELACQCITDTRPKVGSQLVQLSNGGQLTLRSVSIDTVVDGPQSHPLDLYNLQIPSSRFPKGRLVPEIDENGIIIACTLVLPARRLNQLPSTFGCLRSHSIDPRAQIQLALNSHVLQRPPCLKGTSGQLWRGEALLSLMSSYQSSIQKYSPPPPRGQMCWNWIQSDAEAGKALPEKQRPPTLLSNGERPGCHFTSFPPYHRLRLRSGGIAAPGFYRSELFPISSLQIKAFVYTLMSHDPELASALQCSFDYLPFGRRSYRLSQGQITGLQEALSHFAWRLSVNTNTLALTEDPSAPCALLDPPPTSI